ncbi:hypothetical protein [Nocardia sp. Marseille-Q1738]
MAARHRSLLGAVAPVFALVIATAALSENPSGRKLLAGVVGVALVVLRANAQLDTVGVLAGLAAAAAMAAGTVLTKKWGRPDGITRVPATSAAFLGLLSPVSAAVIGWVGARAGAHRAPGARHGDSAGRDPARPDGRCCEGRDPPRRTPVSAEPGSGVALTAGISANKS